MQPRADEDADEGNAGLCDDTNSSARQKPSTKRRVVDRWGQRFLGDDALDMREGREKGQGEARERARRLKNLGPKWRLDMVASLACTGGAEQERGRESRVARRPADIDRRRNEMWRTRQTVQGCKAGAHQCDNSAQLPA